MDFKVRDFPSLDEMEQEINGNEEVFQSKKNSRDHPMVLEDLYSSQRQHVASHRKAKSAITPYQSSPCEQRQIEFSPIINVDQVDDPTPHDKEDFNNFNSFSPDSENFMVTKDVNEQE